MYKDKARQRQAVREAVRRHRAKKVVIPAGSNTPYVIPSGTDVIPLSPGQHEYDAEEGKAIGSIMPDDYGEPEPQSDNPMKVGYIPPRA